MTITPALVKELRDKTGCGMMDCKRALEETKGDVKVAVDLLRKKGLADLAKRASRAANEGIVDAYIHGGGRIAVLVEVNCETDFVARNEDFRQFTHDVAMQIAATSPMFVSRDDVPDELKEAERDIYRAQGLQEGKPENIIDKIIDGRMEKFYQTVCLLEQTFVKNPDITIQDQLGVLVSRIGENVSIKRFIRYQLGEEL
ncbi:MAG: translation elongation factor Ts [Actinomycetota bacterium]|nr:translation elongation factor Ts [Actinomycetota bacterium]